MSSDERKVWEGRYRDPTRVAPSEPAPLLARWLDRLRPREAARALDVACGSGHNAVAMARAGFEVDAVDISPTALAQGRVRAQEFGVDVDWQEVDLDRWDPPEHRYDLIAVFRYRNPALWPRLVRALAPDGWLVAEHHVRSSASHGPSRSAFRVAPQEFLAAFGALRVLHYSEEVEPQEDAVGRVETRAWARIVVCNGDPAVLGPVELALPDGADRSDGRRD